MPHRRLRRFYTLRLGLDRDRLGQRARREIEIDANLIVNLKWLLEDRGRLTESRSFYLDAIGSDRQKRNPVVALGCSGSFIGLVGIGLRGDYTRAGHNRSRS